MKNFLSLFLVLLSTFLFSCEKEDENSVSLSNLNIYGTTIPIKSGVIWESNRNVVLEKVEYVWKDKYTDKEGVSHEDDVVGFFRSNHQVETGNFIVSLYGDGLNFIPNVSITKGEGAVVCLHLASPDLKQLTPGKYEFSESKKANTFIGYLSSSYDMAGTSRSIAKIVGGEVNIVNENSGSYTIDVNVKITNGVGVTCNYKGALEKVLINQPKMAKIQGLALHGLLDSIRKGTWTNTSIGGSGKIEYSETLDNMNKAFLSISSGGTQTSEGKKESVEIVVGLDYTTNEFTFLSPIKARAIMGHLEKNNFPCHTIFMKAPASFGDSDYDNLEKTGISVSIVDEVVKFPVKNLTPGYVFFDAGNGTKGVIKVKGVAPSFDITIDPMPGYDWVLDYYTMSEQLLCDVKATTNYGNPKIR